MPLQPRIPLMGLARCTRHHIQLLITPGNCLDAGSRVTRAVTCPLCRSSHKAGLLCAEGAAGQLRLAQVCNTGGSAAGRDAALGRHGQHRRSQCMLHMKQAPFEDAQCIYEHGVM